ncbi:MAG: protoporphyrinogen oxidase [Sporolactobacillus sp.]
MNLKKSVVVIGGGISGLAAAYYVKQASPDVNVTLFEASDRIGGKVRTVHRSGFTIETGPEGYMEGKLTLTRLIKDIGLENYLIPAHSGTYSVFVNGRLRVMPKGTVMGIPTKMLPMVTTGLVSPLGKARAAMDLFIPRVYSGHDLSVKEFFERRLGGELVSNMVEPLLAGIYNGELSDMSLEMTLPQFVSIEKKYRSLILGMKSFRHPGKKQVSGQATRRFLSLSCGLDVLVDKLAAAVDRIELQTAVKHVQSGRVILKDGTEKQANAIILATTPRALGPLLDTDAAWQLSHDKCASTATVALAFQNRQPVCTNETGYVVSRKEGLRITACSRMSNKWPYTVPENTSLIRSYVGTADHSEMVCASDETITQAVLDDLRRSEALEDPLFSVVTRQIDNMPQYTVGHRQRVAEFEQALAACEGIFACGATLHGVGLPDCVDHACHVAAEVSTFLNRDKVG